MSLLQAKFQAVHAAIANAPQIISVMASDPVLSQRLFMGSGAPSSSTLAAGNGKYCAATSGFVVSASTVAAGTGYVVGDVLTISGGTATTTCQITVDAVTAAGAIADFHVSRTGNYSVYPTGTVSVTGGTGSAATFALGIQPADFYLDYTAKTLYACTGSGSNTTSVWAQISGSGGGGWNYRGAWAAGSYNTNDVVQLGTGTAAGMYLCLIDSNSAAPDSGTGWVQISSSAGTWL